MRSVLLQMCWYWVLVMKRFFMCGENDPAKETLEELHRHEAENRLFQGLVLLWRISTKPLRGVDCAWGKRTLFSLVVWQRLLQYLFKRYLVLHYDALLRVKVTISVWSSSNELNIKGAKSDPGKRSLIVEYTLGRRARYLPNLSFKHIIGKLSLNL